ncbi:rhodanese-like domain-containing protein [Marinivivus vitaminiproducens]|uniref:rhodanese-like domain-containing protein n=1 Tax=Marinivivus vitaminiproducens TaxID=3035935 RepID=UPI0027A4EFA7|nr:rhodanese-like domain-containing protein [Geminicoccaceae bacterium SCSIO 64248]
MRERGEDHVVLDVREAWEVERCALVPSVHVPLDVLPQSLEGLPRDRTLVVVCHHGRRSLLAASFLRQAGFARAVSLKGGVDAWALEVDPDMPRY